ncbi:MAG: serine acetyltransferase [Candidatus Omnitrophica bacterium]|nr:serine acetyltransferase [Candidatus Omnitrophota bacterium]
MKLSLSQEQLAAYVDRQIEQFFPDGTAGIGCYLSRTLERVDYCFSRVRNKYFLDGEQTLFNHLHSDQYAMFLYFLSNTVWRTDGNARLASKIYGLNKALHAVDLFYEVELPSAFLLSHPVGTVLGRGNYADYFVVYQNCTVGSNLDGEYPVLEEGVVMYGGCSLIGRCHIQQNTWIAAGTLVMDRDLPRDQVVFGRHPLVASKSTRRNVQEQYFLS